MQRQCRISRNNFHSLSGLASEKKTTLACQSACLCVQQVAWGSPATFTGSFRQLPVGLSKIYRHGLDQLHCVTGGCCPVAKLLTSACAWALLSSVGYFFPQVLLTSITLGALKKNGVIT